MAENDDASASPDADVTPTEIIDQAADPAPPAPAPASTSAPAPAAGIATRWRDTLWTFRSVVAVAVATFLIGGIGGALVVAASNDGQDHPDRGRMMWIGPGDMGGMRGGPFDDRGPGWKRNGGRDQQLFPPGPPMATPQVPTPSAPKSGSTG
jgi:hypothetical protein